MTGNGEFSFDTEPEFESSSPQGARAGSRGAKFWFGAVTILTLVVVGIVAVIVPFGSSVKCKGRCTVTLTEHDVPLNYGIWDFVPVLLYDKDGKFQSNGIVREALTDALKKTLEDFVKENRVLRVARNCPSPKCFCEFKPEDEDILQKVTTNRKLIYSIRTPVDDLGFVIRQYTINVDSVRSVFNGRCVDTPLKPEAEIIPAPGG